MGYEEMAGPRHLSICGEAKAGHTMVMEERELIYGSTMSWLWRRGI
jgi:hypothetical protein